MYTVRCTDCVGKCLLKFSLAGFLSFHSVVVQNKSKELQTCFCHSIGLMSQLSWLEQAMRAGTMTLRATTTAATTRTSRDNGN